MKGTVKRTPSGYPAGDLRASDGTRYEVKPSGQIVRREAKMTKAELKRQKKDRRRGRRRHQMEATCNQV
jgi:hypothetical protein